MGDNAFMRMAAEQEASDLRRKNKALTAEITLLRGQVERQKTALQEITEIYTGSHSYRAKDIAIKALSSETKS